MKARPYQLATILIALMLGACSNNGMQVNANFGNTQDIAEGTSVYFGNKVIGSVSDVSKTEHGSKVQMALDIEMSKKVNRRAAVVVNRLRQGAPLELHNPPGIVHNALENGQELEALDSMLQLVSWGIGSSFEAGTDSISAFKDYLKSDEFQREKAGVGIAIDQGMKAAKEGILEAEKTIEDVVNEMNLSEQELAEVVSELGDEVAPLVEEFAQGGTELMLELERFAQNLEQSSAENQQTGEEFLESLTEALETLNESLDKGVEQGLNSDDGGEIIE